MTKRFSAHYIYMPAVGYLKQAVVELDACGEVVSLSLLLEEVEGVEWLPGVIALIPSSALVEQSQKPKRLAESEVDNPSISFSANRSLYTSVADLPLFNSHIQACQSGHLLFRPYLFYPFDFTSMQPVAGTRHRLLR